MRMTCGSIQYEKEIQNPAYSRFKKRTFELAGKIYRPRNKQDRERLTKFYAEAHRPLNVTFRNTRNKAIDAVVYLQSDGCHRDFVGGPWSFKE